MTRVADTRTRLPTRVTPRIYGRDADRFRADLADLRDDPLPETRDHVAGLILTFDPSRTRHTGIKARLTLSEYGAGIAVRAGIDTDAAVRILSLKSMTRRMRAHVAPRLMDVITGSVDVDIITHMIERLGPEGVQPGIHQILITPDLCLISTDHYTRAQTRGRETHQQLIDLSMIALLADSGGAATDRAIACATLEALYPGIKPTLSR